jgi:hypothetical protein
MLHTLDILVSYASIFIQKQVVKIWLGSMLNRTCYLYIPWYCTIILTVFSALSCELMFYIIININFACLGSCSYVACCISASFTNRTENKKPCHTKVFIVTSSYINLGKSIWKNNGWCLLATNKLVFTYCNRVCTR